MNSLKKYYFFILTIFIPFLGFSQSEIDLKGTLIDSTDFPIPYAAVSLLENKNVGAYTTEDGDFLLTITENDYADTLSVSCIGYKTLKLSLKDFMALKDHKVIVEESITSLSEVEILAPNEYAKRALKNLKNTTIKKRHQIKALYRVTTTESGKAKHFVEYYLKILDQGPTGPGFLEYEFAERRQSADYRIYRKQETTGNFENLNNFNILRNPSNFKKSKWKKIGDTSYDGEDIIILQNASNTKIYVGLLNYEIYKISKGSLLYIYNKDQMGKMHLGYHKREWHTTKKVKEKGATNTSKLKTSIRYEFITLNVTANKKKMESIKNMAPTSNSGSTLSDIKFKSNDTWSNTKDTKRNTDKALSSLQKENSKRYSKPNLNNIKYNATFWLNLQMPPETKFFKKTKDELESHYGISFENQLKLINK